MPIEIQVDMHNVINAYDELALLSGQVPGAIEAAIDDTLLHGEAIAEDTLGAAINAPMREIQKRVFRSRSNRTTRIVISGNIRLGTAPIPLRRLSPVQTASGVTYKPYRSGNVAHKKSAFGPNIPRLGRGVFKRTGKKRSPIKREKGLVLRGDPVAQSAMQKAKQKIDDYLQKRVIFHIENAMQASTEGRTAYGLVFSIQGPKGKQKFGSIEKSV